MTDILTLSPCLFHNLSLLISLVGSFKHYSIMCCGYAFILNRKKEEDDVTLVFPQIVRTNLRGSIEEGVIFLKNTQNYEY
jgi:hypothetical protein